MPRKTVSLFLVFVLVIAFSAGSMVVKPRDSYAAPAFSMPFPCGQTWQGQTRTNHNPQLAVDLNRTDDLGDSVVASAAGTVSVVRDFGGTSYGKYIIIDHGSGW